MEDAELKCQADIINLVEGSHISRFADCCLQKSQLFVYFLKKMFFIFFSRSSVSGGVDVSETSERIGIRTAEHKEIHALISYKGISKEMPKYKLQQKF